MHNSKIDESVFLAQGSVVVGDVTIGENSSVWYNAVIRGDDAPINIGCETNIQDNAVVHIGKDYPTVIGDRVTVGHLAIVHGCTVGDDCLIGMGAIIMNGAVIGKNCIIGAGSLVTQGKVVPDGSLVIGSPAKVIRQLTEDELASIRRSAQVYVVLAAGQKES